MVFDKVVVNPTLNPSSGIQIKFFPGSTTWETTDFIRIYVEIERVGGAIEVKDLLNLKAEEIEVIMGRWNTIGTNFL